MNPGPKRQTLTEKAARGTLRKSRDSNVMQLVEPDALPMQPQWLIPLGQEVWEDDLGRVIASKLGSERDSTAFANYCNLQGMIVKCWRAAEAPPVTISGLSGTTSWRAPFRWTQLFATTATVGTSDRRLN